MTSGFKWEKETGHAKFGQAARAVSADLVHMVLPGEVSHTQASPHSF